MATNNSRRTAGVRRLLLVQIAVTLGLTAGVLIFRGWQDALSSLLGGSVCVAGNSVLAGMLFRHHGARAARDIVKGFYRGEALKLVLTIGLFAVIFSMVNIRGMAFFAGFILVQMVMWFAPLIFHEPDRRKK